MSHRVITKTYEKPKKLDHSALAFDAIFNSKLQPIKAASTNTKWGKTSFTSTRSLISDKNSDLKRPFEISDDPFSFDIDISPKKPKKTHNNTNHLSNGNFFDKNRNISKTNGYNGFQSEDELSDDIDSPKIKKFFTTKRTKNHQVIEQDTKLHETKKTKKLNHYNKNMKKLVLQNGKSFNENGVVEIIKPVLNGPVLNINISNPSDDEIIWNSILTDRLNESALVESNSVNKIFLDIEKNNHHIIKIAPSNEDLIFPLKSSQIYPNSDDTFSLSQPDTVNSEDIVKNPIILKKSSTIGTCSEINSKFTNRRLLNHKQTHAIKRARYKHFVWNEPDEMETAINKPLEESDKAKVKIEKPLTSFDFPEDSFPTSTSIPLQLTMVVRNVRPAHETQESGETQEFKDDVKYIMDGLFQHQSLSTRCLSAISLLNKCGSSSFRMYLRAHGVLDQVFAALDDSHQYHTLALCCSAIFLLMSFDRLSLDIDLKTCNLLLQLCSAKSLSKFDYEYKDFQNIQSKIHSICNSSDLVKRTQLRRLSLKLTTVSRIAVKALLRLASRKDIEFFRDELKSLKGLDLIIDIVVKSTNSLVELSTKKLAPYDAYDVDDDFNNDDVDDDDDDDKDSLFHLLESALEVLENMSFLNISNQEHLIMYDEASLVVILKRLFVYCSKHLINELKLENNLKKNDQASTELDLLLAVLRLLLNITNENEEGTLIVGQQQGLIEEIFYCVVNLPILLPNHQRFNFVVLCLSLLTNLVENSTHNQHIILNSRNKNGDEKDEEVSSLVLLAQIFSQHFTAAKIVEDEGELDRSKFIKPGRQPDITASSSTLQKADKHMEDSIIAAYVALLIGCIIQNNSTLSLEVQPHIPENKFEHLHFSLQKFLNFMNLTSGVRPACCASMMKILDVLASF